MNRHSWLCVRTYILSPMQLRTPLAPFTIDDTTVPWKVPRIQLEITPGKIWPIPTARRELIDEPEGTSARDRNTPAKCSSFAIKRPYRPGHTRARVYDFIREKSSRVSTSCENHEGQISTREPGGNGWRVTHTLQLKHPEYVSNMRTDVKLENFPKFFT